MTNTRHLIAVPEPPRLPKTRRFNQTKLSFELHRFLEHHKGQPNKVHLEEELNHEVKFIQLVSLCQLLCEPKFELPFSKIKWYGRDFLECTDPGKWLIDFLRIYFHELKDARLRQHLSPNLEVVLQICEAALSADGKDVEKVGFVHSLSIDPDDLKLLADRDIDIAVQSYNDLVLTIRKALLSTEMREAVKSFRRNSTERYKHVMRVCRQAWEKHTDILLIRLDWGFFKSFPVRRISLMRQDEFEALALYVDKARRKMLKRLTKRFGRELAFYVWKIEVGEFKGFHIHWFIGVNGSEHQDRVNIPRMIAKDWDSEINDQSAYTWNVNAMSGAEAAGLRVVSYRDQELWEILGMYADYVTKADFRCRPRLPAGMRTLGCSKLRTVKKAKPGPKRHFQMSHLNALAVRGLKPRQRRSATHDQIEGTLK